MDLLGNGVEVCRFVFLLVIRCGVWCLYRWLVVGLLVFVLLVGFDWFGVYELLYVWVVWVLKCLEASLVLFGCFGLLVGLFVFVLILI